MTLRRPSLAWLLVVPAIVVGTFYEPGIARSFPTFPAYLPNRATATGSDNTQKPCITCHNNPDGGNGCATAPCLNPFGVAFQGNNHLWSMTLAFVDSDGDGFSNGQELQDPTGTWTIGTVSPGNPAYVTRPGFSAFSPGQTDADGDGYCYFGRDMNGDHDCLDAGENTNDRDCNDGAATINSGAPELCTNAADDDCDGLDTFADAACADFVDFDRDGYCPMGTDMNGDRDCTDAGENTPAGDCDDANVLVRPDAPENCQDGIDNDCDTFVDSPDDPNCTGEADFDDDGYCPIGRDVNDNGNCLDAGESALPSDCNDYVAAINPGATEVCGDLEDNNCNQLADFADAACAPYADGDGDGYCLEGKDVNRDGNCLSLNGGTDISGTSAGWDCNDTNASVFSLAPEDCLDGSDQDCDLLVDLDDVDCAGYLDSDGDSYCAVGGIDKNHDGDCADGPESSPFSDCDDGDAGVSPLATELCFNGVDDNCNGSTDAAYDTADPACVAYADWDHDGYCESGRDTVHNDGAPGRDGDCTDAGEQSVDSDHFPYDPSISPGNHESCFDYKDNDQDSDVDRADFECDVVNNPAATLDADLDTYCPVGRDVNGDGDCLDAGENYGQSDCDETNPAIGPQSAEIFVQDASPQRCFDYVDNDCDGKSDLLPGLADVDCFYLYDQDGDGVCGHGLNFNPDDDADCLDTDEQEFGFDCDDMDDRRSSTAVEVCTNEIDDDCDGKVDVEDVNCRCQLDSECTDAEECQIGRCAEGVCTYVADPACTRGNKRDRGVCDVGGAAGAGGDPAPSFAVLALAMAVLASVIVRRRVAARARSVHGGR